MKFELKPNVGERSLRAFLDLVILRILARHSMSGYEISRVLTRDFGVIVGPSTIYSKLYTLEKRELIYCIKGRSGNVYSLTEQGHQIVSDMPVLIEETCTFVKAILSSQIAPFKKKN